MRNTDLPLSDRVLAYIREQNLLDGAKTVLCALSGGADSVCLLHILYGLREKLGFQLCAAHYNHQLRGEESRRDEAFAAEVCRKLDIPLYLGGGDVAAVAKEQGKGLEETGRELRYAFLEACAAQLEDCVIATAHQAEDQVETVLLHLVRGSGLAGLAGIPPRRGPIIRPLLFVTRNEIAAYLEEQGLEHVEDSSNASLEYSRNRLRQEVLPVLEKLNPAYTQAFRQMTELVREDEKYLQKQAHTLIKREGKELRLYAAELQAAGGALAARAIRECAGEFGVQPEKKHVDALCCLAFDVGSGSMDLPGNLHCTVREGTIAFAKREEASDSGFPETKLSWNVWTDIPETKYSAFWGEPEKGGKINALFTTFFFKRDKICGNMHVRPRRSGDEICMQGRNVTKSLKKLMIEMKIPAAQRHLIPVFADEAGVLAVLGAGADQRAWSAPESADAVLLITERN